MEQVFADVPVHAQRRITAQLHADGAPTHRDGPEHGHHVGRAQAERQEVRVLRATQVAVAVKVDVGLIEGVSCDLPPTARRAT